MLPLAVNWEVHTTLPHTHTWENPEIETEMQYSYSSLVDLTRSLVAFAVPAPEAGSRDVLLNPIFHIPYQDWSTRELYPPLPRWPCPITTASAASPWAHFWVQRPLSLHLPMLCRPLCADSWSLSDFLTLPAQQSPHFLAPLLSVSHDPLLPVHAPVTRSSARRGTSGQSLLTSSRVC